MAVGGVAFPAPWIAGSGGSGGSGTVTTVSVVTANGVSGSVANATTTPAITLTLGAITPSSVSGSTIGNTNTITLKDTLFTLQDDGDATKQAQFQLSGITTATTRTYTMPDVSSTVAVLGAQQNFTKQQYFGTATLTSSGASIAWDASIAQVAVHTATENTTLANPTNLVNGGTYMLKFIQAASAKTLAFGNAYKWVGGVAPAVSTGNAAVDIFTFWSDGTNMYGTVLQNFS